MWIFIYSHGKYEVGFLQEKNTGERSPTQEFVSCLTADTPEEALRLTNYLNGGAGEYLKNCNFTTRE